MKLNYTIVLSVIGAVYLILKRYVPDFPVSDTVFQVVMLYLLAKLGVEFSDKPANALRRMYRK